MHKKELHSTLETPLDNLINLNEYKIKNKQNTVYNTFSIFNRKNLLDNKSVYIIPEPRLINNTELDKINSNYIYKEKIKQLKAVLYKIINTETNLLKQRNSFLVIKKSNKNARLISENINYNYELYLLTYLKYFYLPTSFKIYNDKSTIVYPELILKFITNFNENKNIRNDNFKNEIIYEKPIILNAIKIIHNKSKSDYNLYKYLLNNINKFKLFYKEIYLRFKFIKDFSNIKFDSCYDVMIKIEIEKARINFKNLEENSSHVNSYYYDNLILNEEELNTILNKKYTSIKLYLECFEDADNNYKVVDINQDKSFCYSEYYKQINKSNTKIDFSFFSTNDNYLYLSSFYIWYGTCIQYILDKNLRDVNNNETIFEKIYPQDSNKIPLKSSNGKYGVKLYFQGYYRIIIIDDKFPFSKNLTPLLPSTNKIFSNIWIFIIIKAVIKLCLFLVSNNTTNNIDDINNDVNSKDCDIFNDIVNNQLKNNSNNLKYYCNLANYNNNTNIKSNNNSNHVINNYKQLKSTIANQLNSCESVLNIYNTTIFYYLLGYNSIKIDSKFLKETIEKHKGDSIYNKHIICYTDKHLFENDFKNYIRIYKDNKIDNINYNKEISNINQSKYVSNEKISYLSENDTSIKNSLSLKKNLNKAVNYNKSSSVSLNNKIKIINKKANIKKKFIENINDNSLKNKFKKIVKYNSINYNNKSSNSNDKLSYSISRNEDNTNNQLNIINNKSKSIEKKTSYQNSDSNTIKETTNNKYIKFNKYYNILNEKKRYYLENFNKESNEFKNVNDAKPNKAKKYVNTKIKHSYKNGINNKKISTIKNENNYNINKNKIEASSLKYESNNNLLNIDYLYTKPSLKSKHDLNFNDNIQENINFHNSNRTINTNKCKNRQNSVFFNFQTSNLFNNNNMLQNLIIQKFISDNIFNLSCYGISNVFNSSSFNMKTLFLIDFTYLKNLVNSFKQDYKSLKKKQKIKYLKLMIILRKFVKSEKNNVIKEFLKYEDVVKFKLIDLYGYSINNDFISMFDLIFINQYVNYINKNDKLNFYYSLIERLKIVNNFPIYNLFLGNEYSVSDKFNLFVKKYQLSVSNKIINNLNRFNKIINKDSSNISEYFNLFDNLVNKTPSKINNYINYKSALGTIGIPFNNYQIQEAIQCIKNDRLFPHPDYYKNYSLYIYNKRIDYVKSFNKVKKEFKKFFNNNSNNLLNLKYSCINPNIKDITNKIFLDKTINTKLTKITKAKNKSTRHLKNLSNQNNNLLNVYSSIYPYLTNNINFEKELYLDFVNKNYNINFSHLSYNEYYKIQYESNNTDYDSKWFNSEDIYNVFNKYIILEDMHNYKYKASIDSIIRFKETSESLNMNLHNYETSNVNIDTNKISSNEEINYECKSYLSNFSPYSPINKLSEVIALNLSNKLKTKISENNYDKELILSKSNNKTDVNNQINNQSLYASKDNNKSNKITINNNIPEYICDNKNYYSSILIIFESYSSGELIDSKNKHIISNIHTQNDFKFYSQYHNENNVYNISNSLNTSLEDKESVSIDNFNMDINYVDNFGFSDLNDDSNLYSNKQLFNNLYVVENNQEDNYNRSNKLNNNLFCSYLNYDIIDSNQNIVTSFVLKGNYSSFFYNKLNSKETYYIKLNSSYCPKGFYMSVYSDLVVTCMSNNNYLENILNYSKYTLNLNKYYLHNCIYNPKLDQNDFYVLSKIEVSLLNSNKVTTNNHKKQTIKDDNFLSNNNEIKNNTSIKVNFDITKNDKFYNVYKKAKDQDVLKISSAIDKYIEIIENYYEIHLIEENGCNFIDNINTKDINNNNIQKLSIQNSNNFRIQIMQNTQYLLKRNKKYYIIISIDTTNINIEEIEYINFTFDNIINTKTDNKTNLKNNSIERFIDIISNFTNTTFNIYSDSELSFINDLDKLIYNNNNNSIYVINLSLPTEVREECKIDKFNKFINDFIVYGNNKNTATPELTSLNNVDGNNNYLYLTLKFKLLKKTEISTVDINKHTINKDKLNSKKNKVANNYFTDENFMFEDFSCIKIKINIKISDPLDNKIILYNKDFVNELVEYNIKLPKYNKINYVNYLVNNKNMQDKLSNVVCAPLYYNNILKHVKQNYDKSYNSKLDSKSLIPNINESIFPYIIEFKIIEIMNKNDNKGYSEVQPYYFDILRYFKKNYINEYSENNLLISKRKSEKYNKMLNKKVIKENSKKLKSLSSNNLNNINNNLNLASCKKKSEDIENITSHKSYSCKDIYPINLKKSITSEFSLKKKNKQKINVTFKELHNKKELSNTNYRCISNNPDFEDNDKIAYSLKIYSSDNIVIINNNSEELKKLAIINLCNRNELSRQIKGKNSRSIYNTLVDFKKIPANKNVSLYYNYIENNFNNNNINIDLNNSKHNLKKEINFTNEILNKDKVFKKVNNNQNKNFQTNKKLKLDFINLRERKKYLLDNNKVFEPYLSNIVSNNNLSYNNYNHDNDNVNNNELDLYSNNITQKNINNLIQSNIFKNLYSDSQHFKNYKTNKNSISNISKNNNIKDIISNLINNKKRVVIDCSNKIDQNIESLKNPLDTNNNIIKISKLNYFYFNIKLKN